MLQDVGVTHVIVGHSECRHVLGQGDDEIAAKFVAALQGDITPILCVGETLAQRESGDAESVVLGQLSAVFEALGEMELPELIIAYEPVWAIGTGVTAKPEDVAQMHAHILRYVDAQGWLKRTRILYGGSVKESNAAELIKVEGVHGFLIGGASLTEEFIKIGELCNSCC